FGLHQQDVGISQYGPVDPGIVGAGLPLVVAIFVDERGNGGRANLVCYVSVMANRIIVGISVIVKAGIAKEGARSAQRRRREHAADDVLRRAAAVVPELDGEDDLRLFGIVLVVTVEDVSINRVERIDLGVDDLVAFVQRVLVVGGIGIRRGGALEVDPGEHG